MERLPFNDLALFATIAREGSFTRAAAMLGVSPSALSHAMRGLEARLGVRLLSRTTRSVSTTSAGEQLLASLAPALSAIERGVSDLDEWRDNPSGLLRITTFGWAARTVLEPRLPEFLIANPQVRVEVDIQDALVDIVSAGFDAGIRFGETLEKDMVAVRVGPDLRTIVVATPDYFRRNPPPTSPYDLERHACINYRLSTSGGLLPWEFSHAGKDIRIQTSGPLVVNDGPLAAAAVRAGAGLGYILEQDVADDLASGRLVQVLHEWCPIFPGCYLYHSSRRQSPPALRALIETLRTRNA
ncbi:LysR family transcriptional regulator [Rhizobium sp. EC-SD404]|uniref:LysR family transcriptional regulator n=1 Tax=Rhizobium sp. EC-SD404 TaxID=2038389 RepID=UPI001256DED6|nr:LysR family transcriptional regulator [Rhizobium sp. EC-SD404]VVT09225.1 putative transcriptional regulator [Rhizobium sp. EC-SD404]